MPPKAAAAPVPESVLKKQAATKKSAEDRAKQQASRKQDLKKKRKTIFQSAAKYVKQYQSSERNLIRMRRQARDNGNYFIEPSPKVVFVVRIRGINGVDPKTRKILQLLRLRQIHNGVFLRFNKATLNMLRAVNPYITYGTPNLKAVRELVYKRGFANVQKQRIAITDNSVIQKELGSENVVCAEDVVHELFTCGKNFGKVSKFLWPFKLNSPSGGFSKKRISFIEGGQYGDRESFISQLVHRMI